MDPFQISVITAIYVIWIGAYLITPKIKKKDWIHVVKGPQFYQFGTNMPLQEDEPTKPTIYTRFKPYMEEHQDLYQKIVQALGMDEKLTELRLYQAGLKTNAEEYIFYRIAPLGIGFVLILVAGVLLKQPMMMLWIGLGAGLFYWYPDQRVKDRIKKRRETIKNNFPDFLDLVVVLLEVGSAPQEAIMQVSNSFHDATGEEFRRAAVASKYNGGQWQLALTEMAEKLQIVELSDVVSSLNLASEKGTPLAPVLREQVARLRFAQQQRAEEKASKMGTKLMPIMGLFIFIPLIALLVVPAFL